jgi:putative hydrolase
MSPAATARVAGDTHPDPLNAHVATVLDETARLLETQRANVFRVQAYRNAAETVRALQQGVDDILDAEGLAGLDRLPGIGHTLARGIDQIVMTGRFPMRERLRSGITPANPLNSVPGIGVKLAQRVREDHGIGTLEQLEIAAHDGTLAEITGFGAKRIGVERQSTAVPAKSGALNGRRIVRGRELECQRHYGVGNSPTK